MFDVLLDFDFLNNPFLLTSYSKRRKKRKEGNERKKGNERKEGR